MVDYIKIHNFVNNEAHQYKFVQDVGFSVNHRFMIDQIANDSQLMEHIDFNEINNFVKDGTTV